VHYDGLDLLLVLLEREILFEVFLDLLGGPLEAVMQGTSEFRQRERPRDFFGYEPGLFAPGQGNDQQPLIEPDHLRIPWQPSRLTGQKRLHLETVHLAPSSRFEPTTADAPIRLLFGLM
jgi:hypothetical protein